MPKTFKNDLQLIYVLKYSTIRFYAYTREEKDEEGKDRDYTSRSKVIRL
jgi:hypothetical protein